MKNKPSKQFVRYQSEHRRMIALIVVVWLGCLILFGYVTYDQTYLCPFFPDASICIGGGD